MTYEEKLDLLINELAEAKKRTRVGQPVKVFVTKQSELIKKLIPQEIHELLLQLQDDEKILTIKEIPTDLKTGWEVNIDKIDYFSVEILDAFDDWCGKRLIANKSRLENLSEQNLKNIIHITHLIELELELDQSEKITIGFGSSVHDFEGYEREDIDEIINTYARGLGYLKNIGVVKDYTTSDMTLSSEITLNIARFFEILEKIKELEQKKSTPQIQTPPTSKKQTIDKPKISYDKQKGVLEIEGNEVKFDKESFRAKLLELLLKDDKNIKKEWSWDEVLEEIEGIKDADTLKENKKKFYPACDGLSKLIAQKTSINNLLIFNKSTVQINPKYL